MTRRGEVFLRALGAYGERVHPRLLAAWRREGSVDTAEGVFAVAGSRFGLIARLGAPLVGPRMLVTSRGFDVPFVLTTTARDVDGEAVLDGSRSFRFSGGMQWVDDRLVATGQAGELRSLLGARRRVEVAFDCTVTDDGALRMISRQVRLRIGRLWITVPHPLGVRITLEDGWDEAEDRRTVDMRAHSPLAGTVLEYRGWYRIVP